MPSFLHTLGGSWVSVSWKKRRVVSSIGWSIINLHMVISATRIMKMYNPTKMIAMTTLKSIFCNIIPFRKRKGDRVELPGQEYINSVAISVVSKRYPIIF